MDGISTAVGAVSKLGSQITSAIDEAFLTEEERAKLGHEISLKQLEVNLQEAKSPSKFIAGWRPFVGWTCSISFSLSHVIFPIAEAILSGFNIQGVQFPQLDTYQTYGLLLGLLGLGGLRTYEKKQGVDTKTMKTKNEVQSSGIEKLKEMAQKWTR